MKDTVAWMLLSENERTAKKLESLRKSFDRQKTGVDLSGARAVEIMNDIEKACAAGAEVITYIDERYPECLRMIASPPPYLYVKGHTDVLKYPLKATIVGSRGATAYGLNIAAAFAHELSSNNICVVSGGAKGIDSAAMRGALRGSAPVICVMGTGIDVVYPKENKKLFEEAAERGAVVTQYPPGTQPLPQNFPMRNRIMTALGDSVVVVEAAVRSGALISASCALEQGKTLFAVPGNIDSPTSAGTNELLRDGALWAMSGSDIIYEMMDRLPDSYRDAADYRMKEKSRPEPSRQEEHNELSGIEAAVVNAIKSGNGSYEEILEYCACDARRLTSTLTLMQIKGIVKTVRGNKYELK